MVNDSNSISPTTVKKTQQRNLIIVVIVLAAIFFVSFMLMENNKKPINKKPAGVAIGFTNPVSDKAIYSASIEQFQSKEAVDENTEAVLQKQIQILQKQTLANKPDPMLAQRYQTVLAQLHTVQAQLKSLQVPPNMPNNQSNNASYGHQQFPTIPNDPNDAYAAQQINMPHVSSDGDDHLQLVSHHKTPKNTAPLMNPDTYVPAGTHVLGVLLQGADLVADQSDQQNPKPILIRVLSQGTLPNQRQSHLTGCIITAAMTGDISSGRGDVRLERLSCVRPNNSIVDVAVFGTAATQAKEGISGQLYTREGSRVFVATFAGMAAGVANGIAQSQVQTQNTLFGQTGSVQGSDVFKYGAASGAGSGLNKLSDFQMNRADQIHPIIQVNGGKLVTVTFLKGFFFDGKQHDLTGQGDPWAAHGTSNTPLAANSNQSMQEDQQ